MPNGNPAMTYLAAAIQMTAGPDKAANLERAERLVRAGAARVARGLQLARQAQRAGGCGRNARRSIAHADVAPGARVANPPRRRIDHRTGRRRVAMLQHVRAARPRRRPNRRVSQDSPLRRRSSRPRDGARIGFQTWRRATRLRPNFAWRDWTQHLLRSSLPGTL